MESLLIVLWECSCPLLNEFYRKRPLMEYPQCKINLLPSSGLIILRALAASGGGVDVTCPRGPCGDGDPGGVAGLRGPPVTDQGRLPRFGGVTAWGAGWGVGVLCLEVNRLFLGPRAASCLTPLFLPPAPGHAVHRQGRPGTCRLGFRSSRAPHSFSPLGPQAQGSVCPTSCICSWWGHIWPHC